jgi:hypothetical protein
MNDTLPDTLDLEFVTTDQLDDTVRYAFRYMAAADELLDGLGKLMSHTDASQMMKTLGVSLSRSEGVYTPAIQALCDELGSRPDFEGTWYAGWLDETARP